MASTERALTTQSANTAQRHLEDLVAANESIKLVVLTSGDGMEIAAHPKRNVGLTQRIAAMSSSIQALAAALAKESGLASNRCVIIESEAGAVLVLGVASPGLSASLSVVASNAVSLGHILWAARNCCAALEKSLRR
jgi:predicted regulator of Ras-like GTPase activity (Roadblock/LC7/MglB family)